MSFPVWYKPISKWHKLTKTKLTSASTPTQPSKSHLSKKALIHKALIETCCTDTKQNIFSWKKKHFHYVICLSLYLFISNKNSFIRHENIFSKFIFPPVFLVYVFYNLLILHQINPWSWEREVANASSFQNI